MRTLCLKNVIMLRNGEALIPQQAWYLINTLSNDCSYCGSPLAILGQVITRSYFAIYCIPPILSLLKGSGCFTATLWCDFFFLFCIEQNILDWSLNLKQTSLPSSLASWRYSWRRTEPVRGSAQGSSPSPVLRAGCPLEGSLSFQQKLRGCDAGVTRSPAHVASPYYLQNLNHRSSSVESKFPFCFSRKQV